MLSDTLVELSRWQFALTAMLHFLFIPLTLGLGLLLAVWETVFAVTGRANYLKLIDFWRPIFAINFLLAFATRLTVVLQFGMNGSYFAHYVGDVFALPLAIEVLSGFFPACILFSVYWFGRGKLGKTAYCLSAWLIALTVHGSAFWIMLANAWMQNPVGAAFNPFSYRIELLDLSTLLDNPIALGKFVHTAAASHAAAAAAFVAIASFRLRQDSQDPVAKTSINYGSVLGLAALVVVLAATDRTPSLSQPVQQAKLAAISGDYPAALQADLATHIRNGQAAFALLEQIRDDNRDPKLMADFDSIKADLGYALLLKPFSKQIAQATDKQIALAAQNALPGFPKLLYWVNRAMIACGFLSLFWFMGLGWQSLRRQAPHWLLTANVYLAALPWLACIAGWFVAEAGKQPWSIAGVLPIAQSISSLSIKELVLSLLGYVTVYGCMLAAAYRLLKAALINPQFLGSGDCK